MNLHPLSPYIHCLIFGIAAAIGVWRSDRRDRDIPGKKPQQRYLPYFSPYILLIFFLILSLLGLVVEGFSTLNKILLPYFFKIFLHVCIYHCVMLLLLKPLRRYYSARVCATLWLLPNAMQLAYNALVVPDHPLLILPLPFQFGTFLFILWIFGFIAFLSYHVITHILLRRDLLRNAQRAADRFSQSVLYTILDDANFKYRNYKLFYSPSIRTPLSIGFSNKNTCIILPQREYSEEELRLVLRHEIIHIGRQDAITKFFMVFCACVFWFNPLSWIAVRRCNEDLELSCDETVLLDADAGSRAKYADLLLQTAGDDRGFTTCLSSSAKTMLHRLKATTSTGKRRLGSVLVGICMTLLLVTCGLTAFSYNYANGKELIFDGNQENYVGSEFAEINVASRHDYIVINPEALNSYLSNLEFYDLTNGYAYDCDTYQLCFGFDTPDFATEVRLTDHRLDVINFYPGRGYSASVYYHNNDIDWEYLLSLGVLAE